MQINTDKRTHGISQLWYNTFNQFDAFDVYTRRRLHLFTHFTTQPREKFLKLNFTINWIISCM
jgi:hypothetical protein